MTRDERRWAVEVARVFAHGPEDEWPPRFEELRRRRRLSATERPLNSLLKDPGHRPLTAFAFKRIDLWLARPD